VKPYYALKMVLFFFVLFICSMTLTLSPSHGQTPKKVEDLYPGLASDSFKSATLAKLPKGVLLTSGTLIIKESELTRAMNQSEPAIRKQLSKNAFYLLEKIGSKRLVFQEAHKAGYKKEDDEDQTITTFLSEKVKPGGISEGELNDFYNQNTEMFQGAPFEQVQGVIKHVMTQQKKQEAHHQYVQALVQRTSVQLNEDWVKRQSILSRDNPVDRVRMSGKPSLIEFGATGCGPCDMMTPILADLEKKYKNKLNVLFVHVNQEEVLTARFGIKYVPVQVLFDKNGREVFRHTGFFPQTEIEKKLTQFSLTN
jgi:thiol-disulfide isomerase/thioredoxin